MKPCSLLKYINKTLLATMLAALCMGAFCLPPAEAAFLMASQAEPEHKEKGDSEELPAAEPKADAVVTAPAHSLSEPSLGSYLSGRFAETMGDTTKGIGFLKKSLKRDPNNKDMLASLYRMLMLSGNIEEALPIAAKLSGTKVAEDGSEFTPELLLAIDEAKQGKYSAARSRLQTIPRVGFNSLLLPLLDTWLKLGAGEVKAPVEAKDMMPDAKTILPHVYLSAAFINDVAGFSEQAEKQYEASVKDVRLEPFRAVEAFANYYSRTHKEDKRRKLISDYVSAHGNSFLANELLAEPQSPQIKPLVTSAKEGLAEVFYAMANIFHGIRAPADEITTLRLALYLRPDFPAAQFLLAGAYELVQDYRNAVASYQSIDKDSAYFVRGRIRAVYDESDMGKGKVALSELDAIAAERPGDIDALLAKGDILRAGNHFKEAADAYSMAAERVKTPQKYHWIIYFSRGTCYERMNQWDKAETDMKKALELSPGEPNVLNYLGYSWLMQNRNIAEAKKMIEDAYDARPEDAHIIDSMGYALYISGDFASAQEYYEQALERMPDDPTVNEHLGDVYWQLGRKTEARYQWQRALADDPDADTERSVKAKLEKGLPLLHPLQAVGEKKPAPPAGN